MTKCCSFSFLDTKKEADKRIKVLEEELSPTDLPPSTEEESSEAVVTTSAAKEDVPLKSASPTQQIQKSTEMSPVLAENDKPSSNAGKNMS